MNTASSTIPILPATGDHEYCLEDLELAFPKKQLQQITKEWNSGWSIESIAENIQRDPDEVFLALFHQARKNKIKRKYSHKPAAAGDQYKAVVEVKKLKKGEPSVIEIDGKRFIYEPETKRK
ncbi:hypothetical protein ACDX78_10410 [Virgibacillus oceani]